MELATLKKILPRGSKEVTYLGLTLHVPLYTRYMATNKDGTVYAFRHKPAKRNESWFDAISLCEPVAQVELHPSLRWYHTLENIDGD